MLGAAPEGGPSGEQNAVSSVPPGSPRRQGTQVSCPSLTPAPTLASECLSPPFSDPTYDGLDCVPHPHPKDMLKSSLQYSESDLFGT